ncbi:hypothetical protein ACWDYH_31275 [Nocardia goodfellowii]
MSWQEPPRGLTDPRYYADAASDTERELRADFAKFHLLGENEPAADTPDSIAERNGAADEISQRWKNHPEVRWRWLWRALDVEATQWEIDPDRTRKLYEDLARAREASEPGVDEQTWRTLRQARELTGHTDGVSSASVRSGVSWRLPGPQLRAITNADSSIGAKTRDRHLRAVPDSGADPQPSAADRALGAPRQWRLLDMAEVEQAIAATDELLNHEELAGDLDTGTDQRAARSPSIVAEPSSAAESTLAEQRARHASLLAEVRDLAAEHARLNGDWDPDPDYAQARITRLEETNNLLIRARRAAASAGAGDAAITAAYRAGRDGISSHQDPTHNTPTVHGTGVVGEQGLHPGSGLDSGPDPVSAAESGGREIGAAIDAALDGFTPDWDGPEACDAAPTAGEPLHLSHSEELNR